MATKYILLIIGVVIILGAAAGFAVVKKDALPEAETLPDMAFENYAGETVRLSDLRGTPLVLNSWAVWCPFCREELKDFAEIQREFGDRVRIVAIDRAEPLSRAKAFTDEIGVTNMLTFLLDPDDKFYKTIGGFSMPETVFIDALGVVQVHKRGPITRDEMRNLIQSLLQ